MLMVVAVSVSVLVLVLVGAINDGGWRVDATGGVFIAGD